MEPALATQQFIDVKTIKDGVVYLKRGGLRKILVVGGINFDLKSEDEQNLILGSFQSFLNTLDFPVQFFVHSRKINVDHYLQYIDEQRQKEPNELLKIQIEEYMAFIRAFVEQNPIITKGFFVIVPYDPILLSSSKSPVSFLGLFKKKVSTTNEDADLIHNLQQLTHRVDQVVEGLASIGLRVAPLPDEELVELFYNLYNPQLIEKKGIGLPK